jgi:uncharacterized DUF497 family protein
MRIKRITLSRMARLDLVWDRRKAAANHKKHGISFEEASTVFDDPLVLFAADWEHGEPPLVAIGSSAGRVLFVVSLEIEDELMRIVSARKATNRERQRYEEKD